MRVTIAIKQHSPGGVFVTPEGTIYTDANGEAEVSKKQFDYLTSQGHIDVKDVSAKADAKPPKTAKAD